MRATGPSHGNLVAIGAGQGRNPPAGAVVSVRVLESLGGGLYRVAAGSLQFTARSETPLARGVVFLARVERPAGTLVFRPLAESCPRETLSSAPGGEIRARGAQGESLRGQALAALLGEGGLPQPAAVERLMASFRRARARASAEGSGEDAEDRASLAARMEAKGIPAEDAAIDAIQACADGSSRHRGGEAGDDEGRRGSGEAREEGNAGPASETYGIDADRELDLELAEEELPQVLGSLLKGIAFRSGGSGDLLHLFNHVRGPDGSWVYAPFRFELDSIAFEGMIRIRLPRIVGGPGRIEAGFTAGRGGGGRRWSFALEYGGRATFRLRCDDAAAEAASRRRLPELQAAFAGNCPAVEASFMGGPAAEFPAGREDLDVEA